MANVIPTNPSDRSVWIIKPDGNIEGGILAGAFPSALAKHRKDHLDKLIEAGVTDYVDLTTSLERKRFGEYKGYIQSTMADKEEATPPTFHEATIDPSIKEPRQLCHEAYKAALDVWNLVRQNKVVYVFDTSFDGRAALVCLFAVFQDFNFDDDPVVKPGETVTLPSGEKKVMPPDYVPRKGVDKKRTVTTNVSDRLKSIKLRKENKLGLFSLVQTRAIGHYDERNASQLKWMQAQMAKHWAREKAAQAKGGKPGVSIGPNGLSSPSGGSGAPGPSQETLDKINEIIAQSSGKGDEPLDLDRNESRQMLMELLAQVKNLPVEDTPTGEPSGSSGESSGTTEAPSTGESSDSFGEFEASSTV